VYFIILLIFNNNLNYLFCFNDIVFYDFNAILKYVFSARLCCDLCAAVGSIKIFMVRITTTV